MVQNVRYLNGPPSHVTLPFEYRTPTLSGIQVFGIQMVTVIFWPQPNNERFFVLLSGGYTGVKFDSSLTPAENPIPGSLEEMELKFSQMVRSKRFLC